MAPADRGDSMRETEGRIPLMGAIAEPRPETGGSAVANWMGVSRQG